MLNGSMFTAESSLRPGGAGSAAGRGAGTLVYGAEVYPAGTRIHVYGAGAGTEAGTEAGTCTQLNPGTAAGAEAGAGAKPGAGAEAHFTPPFHGDVFLRHIPVRSSSTISSISEINPSNMSSSFTLLRAPAKPAERQLKESTGL